MKATMDNQNAREKWLSQSHFLHHKLHVD